MLIKTKIYILSHTYIIPYTIYMHVDTDIDVCLTCGFFLPKELHRCFDLPSLLLKFSHNFHVTSEKPQFKGITGKASATNC